MKKEKKDHYFITTRRSAILFIMYFLLLGGRQVTRIYRIVLNTSSCRLDLHQRIVILIRLRAMSLTAWSAMFSVTLGRCHRRSYFL